MNGMYNRVGGGGQLEVPIRYSAVSSISDKTDTVHVQEQFSTTCILIKASGSAGPIVHPSL